MKTFLLSLLLAAISNALPAHPRLLITEADWPALPARMEAEPAVKGVITHTITRADEFLSAEKLTHKLEGRRLLSVSRDAIARILALSTAWKTTGEEKYFVRCREELLNLSAFKDWHPDHHLDTAEMQTAVAIGYDWLFHDLSAEDRKTIASALMGKGLKSTLANPAVMTTDNNWNQVCNGGVILSSLALHELDPKLCDAALDKAIKAIPIALKTGYSPDGYYSEGASYWSYGTTYSIISLEALKTCGYETSFISKHPGFLESGNYIAQVHGTSGTVYNYGDSNPGPPRPDLSIAWMARANRSSAIRDFVLTAFHNIDDKKTNSFLPLAAFWIPTEGDVETTRLANHFLGDGTSPIAIHRTGSAKDELYLGIKAGKAGVNHGHMDEGSFVLDFLGQRWASDLGSQNYHSLEKIGIRLFGRSQDSDRWTVFRLNNLSHNTLTYNGQLHRVDGYANIVSPAPGRTEVDLTSALGLPKGASAIRDFKFDAESKTVTVTDSIKGLKPGDRMDWNMMTRAVANKSAQGYLLSLGGKELSLELSSEQKTSSSAKPADLPPLDHDELNPGVTRINLETTAGSDGEIKITAVFQEASDLIRSPGVSPWKLPQSGCGRAVSGKRNAGAYPRCAWIWKAARRFPF